MAERLRSRIASVVRRRPVLIGLMLLAVGTPEVMVGHTKARSYRERLASLPVAETRIDPTQLYPKRSATDEKRAVALAKIHYYELVRSAGSALVLAGLVALGLGVARRPASEAAARKARDVPDVAR